MDRVNFLMADTNTMMIPNKHSLTVTEQELLKKSRFNLVIKNVPTHGIERDTNKNVVIRYCHMKDTLRQISKLMDIKMFGSTVYCEFVHLDGAYKAHNILNKMQIGNNIISTFVF